MTSAGEAAAKGPGFALESLESDEASVGASDEPEIPPSLFARFESFVFLGRGGMGAVYRARDFRLGRDVAVKLLFGADPEKGGSVLREARSQARLEHENACKVHEAGVADHVRFIVMQLIHGAPLDAAQSGMTLEEKVGVIRKIASALQEAHRIGILHRDVKPSNILVERGEDGAWKPYIMDFGLAREMGDSGNTVTGTIMGTPAFMAPEQAAGKVRSLDRRTDVYSLGATLYDVLAGRKPFVADSLIQLLDLVINQEPLPIRKVDRNIPQDLEAIVMKCLEKEPGARYESARALGDDLQRFLDGEPVKARRASLAYVLFKRAKKHRAAVALAGAALVAMLVVAALWVRGRRIAAEQATLSRELGESVKEMELFLRSAHGMPLHDIERERDLIRTRLGEIEAGMATAGKIGQGPGHYALGRGHLTLQEPEAALEHLKKAKAAGYTSFGLDYALGISLSELYRSALQKTKRIENAEQRRARVAAIEDEYKVPMLQHLRAALGGSIEAPAYVEGLIAFYEGRHDEARALAQKAFAKAPWLYEAKKLEGDILFAVGSRYRADAAFDHDQMMIWFRQAEDAYRTAADLGRSDPAIHEADCDLWTQVMNAASQHDESMRPSFEAACAACERAIAASSKSASGQLKLAQAHNSFAWWVATGDHPGENPERAIDEAVKRAEAAAQRSPTDPMAPYSVGAVWRTRAIFASNRGLDVGHAVERGIAGYKEALRLDPAFPWALNELCALLSMRARWEDLHGKDPQASLTEAVAQCDRAIALDAGFLFPKMGLVVAYITKAEYLLSTGRSPEAAITPAIAAIESVKKQNPTWIWIPSWLAHLRSIEAAHATSAGEDPTLALERAEESTREVERLGPSSTLAHLARGEVSLVKARWRGAREEDPTPALGQAREAFRLAVEAKPLDLDQRVLRAGTEITAIRWAMKHARADEAHFEAALAPLLPLLGAPRADPSLYQALAEIHELRAGWLLHRKKNAEEEIAKGLQRAEEALALDANLAAALAGKGRLLLLRAKQEGKPERRGEDALQALAALTEAVRENPLLERTHRSDMEEAKRLAGENATEQAP